MNERLLLVEDDSSVREATARGLEASGFRITTARDGRDALANYQTGRFALIVLDVMLPEVDGLEVCREIRKSSDVPIIMLTARTDAADVVAGLEVGADDYVTKPFDMPVLVARVRAALRRASTEGLSGRVISVGALELDSAAFKARKDGVEIPLTATEFRLLEELMRHAGQVMTRDVLLSRVWDYEYLGDSRVVDMAVKRLRRKIEDDPHSPTLIETVRGVGYRLRRPG